MKCHSFPKNEDLPLFSARCFSLRLGPELNPNSSLRVMPSCFETGAAAAAFERVDWLRFCQREVKVTETASRGRPPQQSRAEFFYAERHDAKNEFFPLLPRIFKASFDVKTAGAKKIQLDCGLRSCTLKTVGTYTSGGAAAQLKDDFVCFPWSPEWNLRRRCCSAGTAAAAAADTKEKVCGGGIPVLQRAAECHSNRACQ